MCVCVLGLLQLCFEEPVVVTSEPCITLNTLPRQPIRAQMKNSRHLHGKLCDNVQHKSKTANGMFCQNWWDNCPPWYCLPHHLWAAVRVGPYAGPYYLTNTIWTLKRVCVTFSNHGQPTKLGSFFNDSRWVSFWFVFIFWCHKFVWNKQEH